MPSKTGIVSTTSPPSTSPSLHLFKEHFSSLKDPCGGQGKLHTLHDILVIALLAIICGADEFTDMEEFGKSKASFLGRFLILKNGIPSHDSKPYTNKFVNSLKLAVYF